MFPIGNKNYTAYLVNFNAKEQQLLRLNTHITIVKVRKKAKSRDIRLRAKKRSCSPIGNFADISYLEENFKPHLLRAVCTLCSGALVSDSLLHMLL